MIGVMNVGQSSVGLSVPLSLSMKTFPLAPLKVLTFQSSECSGTMRKTASLPFTLLYTGHWSAFAEEFGLDLILSKCLVDHGPWQHCLPTFQTSCLLGSA